MATLALAVVGSAVGSAIGGTILGVSAALIGQVVGATIGRYIDGILFGSNRTIKQEGIKIDEFNILSSMEGEPITRGYGYFRTAGNLIWASRWRREVRTETQGGGGGGKGGGGGQPSVETTTYHYYANFAVGACEGEVRDIMRIWADGRLLDLSQINYRVYTGSETQMPDSLIEAIEGISPAYRGLAYVVFENFYLNDFGNRLPQIEFEVNRLISPENVTALREQISSVNLLPGSGEFTCEPEHVVEDRTSSPVKKLNSNLPSGETDWKVGIDHLQDSMPNCETVTMVATWFGDDLRIGECEIRPRVEVKNKNTSPISWKVDVYGRSSNQIPVVSQVDGSPAFGGSFNDASLIRAIQDLKSRGFKVMFYPFIMMDIPEGNSLPNPYSDNAAESGQPAYPWRGRINISPAPGFTGSPDKTVAAATQVDAFYGTGQASDFSGSSGTTVVWGGPSNEWSYSRFILHQASLCKLAGGVDYFCIGTEMVAATRIRDSSRNYPFVNHLKTLAGEVYKVLPGALLGYAADWSEYHSHKPDDGSNDVYFNLDTLWGDNDIDFVGIDNYFPVSDWRNTPDHLDGQLYGSIYDIDYLKSNIEGGEYYDWYYQNEDDRINQVRTPITDEELGEHWVFRQKDIKNWWSNLHFDRYTPEPYIYTTELGEAEGYVEATFTCSEEIIKGPTTIVIDLTSISNNCAVQLYSARYGVSFSNYERIFTSDVNVVGQSTNAIHLEYEVPDEIPYLNYIFTLFLYKPGGGGLRLQYVDVVFKPIALGGEFSRYIDDNGLEWRVHKFTAVNFAGPYHDGVNPEPTVQNFIVNTDIKARFLVVGGGARGGDATTASTRVYDGNSGPETDGIGTSGAGSAGEALEFKNINLAPDTYEVQVGQAGGWKPFDGVYPANGSRFDYVTTLGGNPGETNYSEFVGIGTGGEYAWTISTKAGAGGEYPGAGGGDNPEPATVSVGHLFSEKSRVYDVVGDRWKMKFASGSGGGGAGGPGQLGSVIANEVNSEFYSDQPFNVMDMPEGGAGGPGIVSDITGEPVTYAEGGRGGGPAYWDPTPGGGDISSYSTAPPSTYGSGGVGGFAVNSRANLNMPGGNGQHGVVIVSYPVEQPSPWVPGSKPIVFTEFGSPAVDKSTNQPNVFFDPKSSESALPYFSSGAKDEDILKQYLKATIEYWTDPANNPISNGQKMVDMSVSSVWAYDSRPWPTFPLENATWADAENYNYGHWINGRVDAIYIPELLEHLADEYNIPFESELQDSYGSLYGLRIQGKSDYRNLVEPLAGLYSFDIIESGDKFKAVSRKEATNVATLTDVNLLNIEDQTDNVTFTRLQETELPKSTTLTYQDVVKSYSTGAVSQTREVTSAASEPSVSSGLSLDNTQAQVLVDQKLYETWARRTSSSFSVMPNYAFLEPGDVVKVSFADFDEVTRIRQISDAQSKQIIGESFDTSIFSGGSLPAIRPAPPGDNSVITTPELVFMDLPILDENLSNWKTKTVAYYNPFITVAIFRSASDSNFGVNSTIFIPGIIGETNNTLERAQPEFWDRKNTLSITIQSGQLSSITEEETLSGGNVLAIETSTNNWEVILFSTATLTGNGTYDLTNLIRGSLGTEDNIEDTVSSGARVVILNNAVSQLNMDINDVGRNYFYRYGPATRDIGDDTYTTVQKSFSGRGLKPYSPEHVTWELNSGDYDISWIRRTRVGGNVDNTTRPLSENSELYEVDILDGSSQVVRTLTTSNPAVTYTSAQQSADGITAPFNIRIYQISDSVGRGIAKESTID
jgi:hypothetical protein